MSCAEFEVVRQKQLFAGNWTRAFLAANGKITGATSSEVVVRQTKPLSHEHQHVLASMLAGVEQLQSPSSVFDHLPGSYRVYVQDAFLRCKTRMQSLAFNL